MTIPTDSTTLSSGSTVAAPPAATAPAPRTAAAPSAATRTVRYALHTTRMTVTNVMFMAFTIAMPVGMYLLFGMLFGDQGDGFLRQLIVAGLSPRSFLVGSVMAASAVIVPALAAVGLIGVLTGVEVGAVPFLATLAVLWLGLLPTILIGIVLGMVLKGGTAMAGGVITMMAMAIFGGLWMPLEMFPAWMQSIGQAIPTYWISQLGQWTMYGGELPATGLAVIGAWTLVLGVLCAVSLRRAVGLTRR